ncbi:MAG: hypothetical protein GY803_28650, partial [Chloroflexi bacterium]|nr:hypothetical protein [Chloroflexota bacterium]
MRSRTFILLLLVLLVFAAAVVLFVVFDPFNLFNGGEETASEPVTDTAVSEETTEIAGPTPTATPAVYLETIIIAKTDIPAGTLLRSDLIDFEERPNNNIALVGGYAYFEEEIEEIVGQYAKVDIAEGQAVLNGMLTPNPNELSSFGSDLALYIEEGKVAVAFPITNFSGAAYA